MGAIFADWREVLLLRNQVRAGMRIRLARMDDDPHPVPIGTTGTVVSAEEVGDFTHIEVSWDNGRTLSLVTPPDLFSIIT